ncbi:MAG: hypothetical protein IKN65_08470 [Clostridia bacterium]|nr:hypothetical protein [Clostridia bacterium]
MEENGIKVSEEVLKNISVDELADLKVEVDELVNELQDLVDECNEAINS